MASGSPQPEKRAFLLANFESHEAPERDTTDNVLFALLATYGR